MAPLFGISVDKSSSEIGVALIRKAKRNILHLKKTAARYENTKSLIVGIKENLKTQDPQQCMETLKAIFA